MAEQSARAQAQNDEVPEQNRELMIAVCAEIAAVRHADPWVRELERAARTYYTRYAQDEAYDVEDCCAGEQQHIDAKALRDALANVPAAPQSAKEEP